MCCGSNKARVTGALVGDMSRRFGVVQGLLRMRSRGRIRAGDGIVRGVKRWTSFMWLVSCVEIDGRDKMVGLCLLMAGMCG